MENNVISQVAGEQRAAIGAEVQGTNQYWVDGSVWDYSKWYEDKTPSDGIGFINNPVARYWDTAVDNTSYTGICSMVAKCKIYHHLSILMILICTLFKACAPGWFHHRGKCFRYSVAKTDWDTHETFCNKNYVRDYISTYHIFTWCNVRLIYNNLYVLGTFGISTRP